MSHFQSKTVKMLKKIGLCISLVATVMIWMDSPNVHSRTEQPPVFNAGAPDMSSCNFMGCHVNELNSGPGSIVLAVPPMLPQGTTVTIDVTVSEPDITRYGFQMIALDSNGDSVGEWVNDEANGIGTQFAQGIDFVNHFMIPEMNSGTWTVEYVVPEDNVGEVTFYAAGVAADGSLDPTGDNSYSTSTTSEWVMGSGIVEHANRQLEVYPNPSSDFIRLSHDFASSDFSQVKIFNGSGEVMQSVPNYQGEKIDVSQLAAGVYVVQLQSEDNFISNKLTIK